MPHRRRTRSRNGERPWLRSDLRCGGRFGEGGFTLIEVVISTAIMGAILGAILMVFSVGIRSTDQVSDRLPGPRDVNALALYLTSDVSSAVPVAASNWLDISPAADVGCATGPDRPTVNVLRITSRNPVNGKDIYVASYRYEAPVAPATTGRLWRTFCVKGQAPSSNTAIADHIDPASAPVATIAAGKDSVTMSFVVKGKRSGFPVELRAAIRTMSSRPGVEVGNTTPVPLVPSCQYVKFSVAKAVKSGPGVGPLKAPVPVTIVTNAADGAVCTSVVAKIAELAKSDCPLAKTTTDTWVGSCFQNLAWPESPTSYPVYFFDRVDEGDASATPVVPPVDLDIAGVGRPIVEVETPLPPLAPTNVTAVPGDKKLTISWKAPVLVANTPPVTSYTVTAVAGASTTTFTTSSGLSLVASGLANGTTYTITVRATNSAGTGPASSPITGRPWPPLAISGTVFEDVNYGGGAGRSRATAVGAGGVGRPNVTVELYSVSGGTATLLRATTTDGSGSYAFPTPTCTSCAVRVVSSTVTSARAGATSSLLPVLTYEAAQSGTAVVSRNDMVGGTDPSAPDAGVAPSGATFSTSTGVFSGGATGTAQAFVLVSDTILDGSNLDFGFNFDTVTNTKNSGGGSLRQAITNANALADDSGLAQSGRTSGVENVVFMLPNGTGTAGLRSSFNSFSDGVATISPASPLPWISSTLVLDAHTQPGWSSTPVIELRGDGTPSGTSGLTLTTDATIIRGLTINRFPAHGILISASRTTIEGNWIGVSSAGGAAAVNGTSAGGHAGISVSSGANNLIGGPLTAQMNVLSGNGAYGVLLRGPAVTANVVLGNRIGTNPAGTAAIGNGRIGVMLDGGATGNTVGGTAPGEGNLISGNGRAGVSIADPATTTNRIYGNRIGTEATGTSALGGTQQSFGGVYVLNSAGANTIGGTSSGQANMIVGNAGAGVNVVGGSSISVRGNAIRGNVGLGIDLVMSSDPVTGVTANDGVKSAGSPNQLMDSPVFTSSTITSSTLTLKGYVGSAAGQPLFAGAIIDVYVSDDDPSVHGEGSAYVGSLVANASGNFSATVAVPSGVTVISGVTKLTATATDATGNTSEFAANTKAALAPAGTALAISITQATGTAPFDANDAAGNDSSAANEVLRTNDTIRYEVDIAVNGASAADTTFVFPLPRGLALDVVPAFCTGTGSGLSPTRVPYSVPPITATSWTTLPVQTLTCNVGYRAAATTVSYPVVAKVRGEVPHGTALMAVASVSSSSAVGDKIDSNMVTASVSARVRANLTMNAMGATPNSGYFYGPYVARCPDDNTKWCEAFRIPMLITYEGSGGKGSTPLSSTITFTNDLSPASLYPASVTSDPDWIAAGAGALAKYGARVRLCSATPIWTQPGNKINGTTMTEANSVRDSGTITCSQPGGPGTPVHWTVTNPDTSASTNPTLPYNTGSIAALTAGRSYVISGHTVIDIPRDAVTDLGTVTSGGTTLNLVNRFTGFSPTGIDGTPNDATADPAFDDGRNLAITYAYTGTMDQWFSGVPGVTGNTPPSLFNPGWPVWEGPTGTSTLRAGNGTLLAEQPVIATIRLDNRNAASLDTDATFLTCTGWDPALLHLAAGNYPGSTIAYMQALGSAGKAVWASGGTPTKTPLSMTVQYGSGAFGPGQTCNDADSPTGWTTDPNDPVLGNDPVLAARGVYNKVARVRILAVVDGPTSTNGVFNTLSIALQAATGNPVGTPLATWTSFKSVFTGTKTLAEMLNPSIGWTTSGYNPSIPSGWRGDRMLLGSAIGRIQKDVLNPVTSVWETTAAPTVLAGAEIRYRLRPSLTAGFTPSAGVPVQIEDCLPARMSLVAASASVAPTVAAPWPVTGTGLSCAAGETYVRWDLGPQPVNATIPPITYKAIVSGLVANGAIVTNTARITAVGDASSAAQRSDTASVQVTTTTGIKLDQTALTPVIEQSRDPWRHDLTWDVTLANVGRAGATDLDLIVVLPANTYAGTAFHGTAVFASVVASTTNPAPLNDTYWYTKTAPASLVTDAADTSNLATGATVWCSASSGGEVVSGVGTVADCPATNAEVSALRIRRVGPFEVDSSRTYRVTVTPDGNRGGDVYVNRAGVRTSGTTALYMGPVDASEAVVDSAIAGRVWIDADHDGIRETGEEMVPGIEVRLYATDGVTEIAVGPDGVAGTADDATGPNNHILTTAAGAYRFDGLHSGSYVLRFGPQTGNAFTLQNVGDDASDSDPDPDIGDVAIVMAPGADLLTLDAGLYAATPVVTNGLVVSLDARTPASMFIDEAGVSAVNAAGEPVCHWADLSGEGNHALQATPAMCPTFGVDTTGGYINFAANGYLRMAPTLSPDATVFIVAQSNTPTWNTHGWLAAARGPNGFIIHPWPGGTQVGFFPVNSAGIDTAIGTVEPVSITNPALYTMTLIGSEPVSGVFGMNGTNPYAAPGVARAAGVVPVTLGADDHDVFSRRGDGRYREVLIYDRALDATEMAQMEAYLRAKWRLP